MAKRNEIKQIDTTEFILPLPKESLQAMYGIYFDDSFSEKGRMKGFRYFHICNKYNKEQKMKVSAEMIFKFKNRIWTPNWYVGGGYSYYIGDDHGEYEKINAHWRQFEDYANSRAFAVEKEALDYDKLH